MTNDGAIQDVMRRDRQKILAIGVVCVVAWMAVVMVPWALVIPMVARVTDSVNTGGVLTADEMNEVIRVAVKRTFLVSLLTMAVAVGSTVAFIGLSRRATLREVNERLREISEQLRSLGAR